MFYFPVCTSICLVLLSASEGAIITKVITGHRGHHSFVLRVVAGPFRPRQHHARTTLGKSGETMYWVDRLPEYPSDGSMRKNWYGTDGGFPTSEFYSLAVMVDGKPWKFPKRLWRDCYEPDFSDPKNQNPSARLFKDGKRLTIDFDGSDAAGHYWVAWHLRKDGRATRELHWADVEH